MLFRSWFTAKWIFEGLVTDMAAKVGGYAVLAMLFTLFMCVFDLLFNQLSIRIVKMLK